MKKIRIIITIFIVVCCFGNYKQVSAKSVNISNTSIVNYEYPGVVYGVATAINEYGIIVYDSSRIDVLYQQPVEEAIQSWNNSLGRTILVSKSNINATDDKVDLILQPIEGDSYADMGFYGYGYGNSTSKICISNNALSDSLTGKGTAGYVQLVSTIRHEIGHCLGLKHDNGLVMADLYDAQTNNNSEMLSSATKAADLISKGILPEIPLFNKYAILNIINNRSNIYYLENHRANQIASIFLDSPGGKIAGVNFINLNAEIKNNYNLYKLSVSPRDPYVGTTSSNKFLNKTVLVTEDIISVYGNHYYLFKVDEVEYIVNSRAFL